MARRRDRIFALVIAGVFFVSTVGISVAIIWQVVQDGRQGNTTATPEITEEDAVDAVDNENKLEGKQMDNFTPVATVEELEITDLQVGTGSEVKPGDTVTVDYTGAVAATGKIFQSSFDFGQPVSFPLDGVIAGWKEGMVGMKVDGVRRLLIPADKAYGGTPPEGSGIPANAALVFDVTLRKIGE